ncbi:MAG TPA: hypothetical protein PK843_10440 [bacterium]|nr:hypothetical protein [bacterium]HPN34924.1 hypothetical protein [bacterium]
MFSDYLDLILYHMRSYPGFSVQDLYKLLFQAVLGPEHLLSNAAAAQMRLEQEWASQPAESGEPLFEPVSLDGRLVRLNIRPFKASGADRQTLWLAFYSASRCCGEKQAFIATWRRSLAWIAQGSIALSAKAAYDFDEIQKRAEYPAGRHSQAYRRLHRPAYRLVRLDERGHILL